MGLTSMYMVKATLRGPPNPALTAALFTDVLWSHAHPDGQIQHIRVHAEPGRITTIIYTAKPDTKAALELIECALNASPVLVGWVLL